MKYLDENGLRYFWQKVQENSGIGGSSGSEGTATYTKLINKRIMKLFNPADAQADANIELFVPNDTFALYKNDLNIGQFTVKEMDEIELQTLAQIVSQLGAPLQPISCTYVTNVDNWVNLFMGGETGFIIATVIDANMGNLYIHYNNASTENEYIEYSIKENYSVPINASFFEPKLLWSGESDSSVDILPTFELIDNYEKYQGYIIVYKKEDANQKIPIYVPRIDKTIHSEYNQSNFIAEFTNLNKLKMTSSATWGVTHFIILAIYGCH